MHAPPAIPRGHSHVSSTSTSPSSASNRRRSDSTSALLYWYVPSRPSQVPSRNATVSPDTVVCGELGDGSRSLFQPSTMHWRESLPVLVLVSWYYSPRPSCPGRSGHDPRVHQGGSLQSLCKEVRSQHTGAQGGKYMHACSPPMHSCSSPEPRK